MKKNTEIIFLYILSTCAAILQLLSFNQNLIEKLYGPVMIILTIWIIFRYFKENKNNFMLTYFVATIFVCFIIEIISSRTGFPTGYFIYGSILKPALSGIPIPLSIAFFGTLLTSAALAQRLDFYWKQNEIVKSMLIGLFVLIFDIYLEPAAMKLGFWYWTGNIVSIQNYATWFIFSTIFGYIGLKMKVLSTRLPLIFLNIYIAEVLFFVIMYVKK